MTKFIFISEKTHAELKAMAEKAISYSISHHSALDYLDSVLFTEEELHRMIEAARHYHEKRKAILRARKEALVFYAFKFRKRVSRVENLRYFYSHLKVLTSDSAPEYVVPETLRLLAWKQSTHNLYNNI